MPGSAFALFVASTVLVSTTQPAAAAAEPQPPSYAQPIYVDPPPGYYDPPPGYYDPPPALYEADKPGDPPVHKDPPAGYYDPPPGWYDPPAGYYMPPAALPAPLPVPSEATLKSDDALRFDRWLARRHQLERRQLGWGIVLGASVLTLGLIAAFPPDDCHDCGIFARPIIGVSALILAKISLVSSIINGVALVRHNRDQPSPYLSFGPGSVRLSF